MQSKKFWVYSTILLQIFSITLLASYPVRGDSPSPVDFRNLATGERLSENPSSISEYRYTLWKDRISDIQLETGLLNNELLWIVADDSTLNLSRGLNSPVYPGELQESIPGEILQVDLEPVAGETDRVLLTLNYVTGDGIVGEIIRIRVGSKGHLHLSSIYRSKDKFVRSAGTRFHYQSYSPLRGWERSIRQLEFDGNHFSPSRTLNLPDAARLMALTHRPRNGWMFINRSGDFVITRFGGIQDSVSGKFGVNPHRLSFRQLSDHDGHKTEPIRLPPVKVVHGKYIAVVDNPQPSSGFMGLFGGRETSFIRLFSIRNEKIVQVGKIGPFEEAILDLEVSPANPNQLLWFRRLGGRPTGLEMIDFTEINPALLR